MRRVHSSTLSRSLRLAMLGQRAAPVSTAPSSSTTQPKQPEDEPTVKPSPNWNEKHPALKGLESEYDWKFIAKHPIVDARQRMPRGLFCRGNVPYTPMIFPAGASKEDLRSASAPRLEELMSKATPSPFGRGGETVLDERVRKGKEILAKDMRVGFKSSYSSFIACRPDLPETIPESVAKWLDVPLASVDIVLNKLALYEAGGHFAQHRDTSQGPEHVATLLVGVSRDFEGGSFVLGTAGQTEEWDSRTTTAEGAPYIAFYADTMHEVTPVTSGLRATLQYDVFVRERPVSAPGAKHRDLDNRSDVARPSEEADAGDSVDYDDLFRPRHRPYTWNLYTAKHREEFVKAVGDHFADPSSVPLVLPLTHLYTQTTIVPSRLKSVDREVMNVLLAAGYGVSLTPIKVFVKSDEEEIEETYNTKDFSVSAFEEVATFYKMSEGAGGPLKCAEAAITDEMAESVEQAKYLHDPEAWHAVPLVKIPHAERTGNHAAPAEETYFASGMIIFKP